MFASKLGLPSCFTLINGNHNDYMTTVTCSLSSRETGRPSGWPVSFCQKCGPVSIGVYFSQLKHKESEAQAPDSNKD